MNEVPDMLTVEEAGSILRIGRTTAYTRAKQWVSTNGEEGLPAIHVGRLLRVPTAQFEEHYHVRVTWRGDDLAVAGRAKPKAVPRSEPTPAEPPAKPKNRQARRTPGDQSSLPFAG